MAGSMRLSLIINADGTAAIQSLNRVRDSVGGLDQAAGRAASGGLGSLAGQLKGLAMTAAAALGVSNLAQSFTAANVAAGTLRAGLETVTGSAKAGAVAWAQLQAFAAQTPFSLQQATEGFIKLKAMGLDPSREALLSYANTASAMGKDLSMMIEAVVDASNSSFERLREFGITASQEGDKVSLTFQGVTTTIGNNAAEIEAYLRRIGEVQFAGAIERQSENLGVALSNVGDSWDQLMVEIGDAGLTAVLVEGLREITGWIDDLKTSIAGDLGTDIKVTVAELEAEFSGWGEAIAGIPGQVTALTSALADLPNYVITLRDGTLAIEEQGTAWQAVTELVGFAAQAFVDLPDNLRAAVYIILGEIDILGIKFQAGMDSLGPIAAQAWETIKYAISSAIQAIKIAVAEMVAAVAVQLASLARDMANVAAQVPEVLDIGGMAKSAAAGLNELATGLEGTTANVTKLKEEQANLGKQFEATTAQNEAQLKDVEGKAKAQVDAIRGVIQAGMDEAQVNKDRRQRQAELNAEFAQAVADQEALEKSTKKLTGATDDGAKATGRGAKAANDGAAATRGAAQADKEAEKAKQALTAATEANNRAVQGLIQRYLPARQAAEDYKEAQKAVNAALAGGKGSLKLSVEEASTILAGLAQDQAKAAEAARREADAFYAAWADAVDSLDDTFKGLWRSLITGQGDVLGNLKETVLEWVADLSYQLLLSPLVVPIQTALLGGTGAAVAGSASGMVSGAGTLGSVGNLFSTLSSGIGWFGNALTSVASGAIFSGISTGFSLAAANIGAAGYFGAMGTTLATAGSSFASGAIGTGIGMAAPYLLPAIAAIAAIAALSGAFTGDGYDHEPGYWGVSTGGSGVDNRFRGGRGVSGGFGLSFGVDAASTDEFDWDMWPEYEKQMAAMADMSTQLEQFYGEDVAKAVEKALSDASGEGLWLLTHEFSSSFVGAFDKIIAEAAKTGDDLAVVMEDVFSGIVDYTSMDTYATSIQEAMVIAQTALAMADDLAGTAMGDALELTGEVVDDAKRLADYGLLVRKEGEGAAEAFVRMATQLALLDQAVQQTATDLSDLTAEGVLELSTALVDAFGSLDAATQAQAFYYDQFTTQTEKLVDAIQAAAKTINREIPKLQDELMKLSKDVITEVIKTLPQEAEKTRKAVDDLLRDVAGGKAVYAPLIEGARRWIEDIANLEKSIEAFYSLPDNGRGRPPKALLINDLLGKVDEGLVDFGDTLRRLGFDVDNGAEAFLESLKRIRDGVQEPIPSGGGGTVIDTITTPGDPNAAILAKLLDDLPKTREGFNELIGSIDLTTEAGRKLYAGLLELAPQFDLLYDGAEAFSDWLLGVDEAGQATRELERVFRDWGMTLPENRDALKDLYDSGILTTEQMAILGAYLKELGLVFGDLKDDVDGINELDLSKLRDAYAVLEQAARAEREAVEAQYRARMDAIAAEREALDKQYQARMDAIAAEREALDKQYQARMDAIAAEREAVDALYRARVDAIAAEREAVSEAYRAQSEALAKQAEVAREALSAAEAGLSRIQSALDAFRGEAPRTEMERLRALRQLGAWAASGRLPDEDSLDRAITGASNLDAQDFTSEASYRAAQGSAYSALLALEKVGVKQVSDAERQIAAIETASERAQAAYEAQLKALDDQADQAAAWRDAQLEILARQQDSAEAWREAELARLQAEAEAADAWREAELARLEAEAEAAETWREENLAAIDALLELAAKQIAILEGTYVETKSLAEAIKDFNAALIDAGGEPLSPTQEGLDALLPPMTELVAASTATTTEVVALRQEIVTLRRDLADVATAQVVPLKAIDERLRKWDLDGLPGGTDSTSETALRAA